MRFAYHDDAPSEWLRCTERGTLLAVHNYSPARIRRSTDGGWTWTSAAAGSQVMDVFPGQGDTVFMTTWSGGSWALFRSVNDGVTWSRVANPPTRSYVIAVSQNDGTTLALVVNDSLLRTPWISSDGGQSWMPVDRLGADTRVSDAVLGIDPIVAADGTSFVRSRTKGLFRLRRGETAWTPVSGGLPDAATLTSMVMRPDGRLFVATTAGPVLYTDTQGDEWHETPRTVINALVPSLGVAGEVLCAIAFNRLYRLSPHGNDWTPCSATGGFPALHGGVAISTSGDIYVSDYRGNVSHSSDEGATWTDGMRISARNILANVRVDTRDRLYVTVPGAASPPSGGEGLFRSTDHGTSWTALNHGLASPGAVGHLVFSGDRLFVGTWGDGMYRSTNDGADWTRTGDGIPSNDVSTLLATGAGVIVVGTSSNGFWRSTDNGESWEDANTGIEHSGTLEMCDNRATGTLFATAGETNVDGDSTSTAYRSTDEGRSWTRVTSIVDSSAGTDEVLAVYRIECNNSGVCFGATGYHNVDGRVRYRLFRSLDDGITWTIADTTREYSNDIAFSHDDRLFVTAATGLYRSARSTAMSVVDRGGGPRMPELHVTTQRPAARSVIRFRLPRAGFVRLSLCDLFGREVRLLCSGLRDEGEHYLRPDLSDVPSEVLFLRLVSDGMVVTRRVPWVR